jgi:hypothetical protein
MLKKVVLIFIVIGFFPVTSSASEIFGRISTDPEKNNNGKISELPGNSEDGNSGPGVNVSRGGGFFRNPNIYDVKEKKKIEEERKNEDKIMVLGIGAYADGSLIRDQARRIFLLENGYKVHIRTLEKLKEYAGQEIYDVSYEELRQYKTKNYFIGDLIRLRKDQRIFVVNDKSFEHIKELSELRIKYFGKKISTVAPAEFRLY